MFMEGDFVVHGQDGVFEIVSKGKLNISCVDREKEYFTLQSVYRKGTIAYVPVNKAEQAMRLIISSKEAEGIIAEMSKLNEIEIADEKNRERQYREIVQKHDCREAIQLLKTLYVRKQKRLEAGKCVTALDEKYLRLVEEKILEEFSASLDLPKEEVQKYISEKTNY